VSGSGACLACGHEVLTRWAEARDEEYFSTPDAFQYRRCDRCGALSIAPVPRDRLAQIYPRNYYSFDDDVTGSLTFRIKDWLDRRYFRALFGRLPGPALSVLDVGGGSGAQLSSVRRADPRVRRTTIVDIDPAAGEAARRRGHEYFCGPVERYETAERFDVILMLNLIEHVERPEALLRRGRELLAPGGMLVVKTPNVDSLDARLFRHANWGGYHCPRHWVLFDRAALEPVIARAGLVTREFKYVQGAPFWTGSVLFALRRRRLVRIDADRPAPRHPAYGLLNAAFAAFDMARGPFARTSQMMLMLQAG